MTRDPIPKGFEHRRILFSLALGVCFTLIALNVTTIFRGAAITPTLDDTVNLPGMLFASLCGSPVNAERLGGWRTMFWIGDLVAYSFIAYVAIAVGNAGRRLR